MRRPTRAARPGDGPEAGGRRYRGYRQAGIRLTEEPPAELHSHDGDEIRPYLYALHMFDKAHVVSLVKRASSRESTALPSWAPSGRWSRRAWRRPA